MSLTRSLGLNCKKMTKEEFIKKFSKIEDTFEDEFKAEYNSPELIWQELKGVLDKTRNVAPLKITPKSRSLKLKFKNKWGNYNRFTDEKGGQNYRNIVIDNMTGERFTKDFDADKEFFKDEIRAEFIYKALKREK